MFTHIYSFFFTNSNLSFGHFELLVYFSLVIPSLYLFLIYSIYAEKITNVIYLCVFFLVMCLFIILYVSNLFIMYILIEGAAFMVYLILSLSCERHLQYEALMKYFILNTVASIFILYSILGIHFINRSIEFVSVGYFIGSLINLNINKGVIVILSIIIIMFILGFTFKIGGFFGISWTADLYEGLSIPLLVILTTFYKYSFFYVFIKILIIVFFPLYNIWSILLFILAILTLVVGVIGSIVQYKIRRFIAYSSAGQLAYSLFAAAIGTLEGLTNSFNYYIVYLITNVLFFFILVEVKNECRYYTSIHNYNFTYLSDLKNIQQNKNIFISGLYLVIIISWASVPPLGGFLLKFYIIQTIFYFTNSFLIVMLIIIFSVISVYYYLRLFTIAFFNTQKQVYNGVVRKGVSDKKATYKNNSIIKLSLYRISSNFLMNMFILLFMNSFFRIRNIKLNYFLYKFDGANSYSLFSVLVLNKNLILLILIYYMVIVLIICNIISLMCIGWV